MLIQNIVEPMLLSFTPVIFGEADFIVVIRKILLYKEVPKRSKHLPYKHNTLIIKQQQHLYAVIHSYP